MSLVAQNTGPIHSVNENAVILVCFIGDVRDRVVTVIEAESKPWKQKWQTWVVFETCKEWENDDVAVQRALVEELDLTSDDVSHIEGKWDFLMDIESSSTRILFWARVFLVQLKASTRIKEVVGNGEILGRIERDVSSLNGDTRPGTKAAIALALSKEAQKKPLTIKVRDGVEIS